MSATRVVSETPLLAKVQKDAAMPVAMRATVTSQYRWARKASDQCVKVSGQ